MPTRLQLVSRDRAPGLQNLTRRFRTDADEPITGDALSALVLPRCTRVRRPHRSARPRRVRRGAATSRRRRARASPCSSSTSTTSRSSTTGSATRPGDRLLIQVAAAPARARCARATWSHGSAATSSRSCASASSDQALATVAAGRLRAALAQPFDVAGQRRHVRVSIGCARRGARRGRPRGAAARRRRRRCTRPRRRGKDRVELFSDATRAPDPAADRARAASCALALERASSMVLHYQPQLDLRERPARRRRGAGALEPEARRPPSSSPWPRRPG